MNESPTVNASNFRKSMENPVKPVTVLTPEECLATVIQMKLTQNQYKRMRKIQKRQNAKIFVSWVEIGKIKKTCQPENIDSSKTGEVFASMQSVVTHQISKIMECPIVREKCDKLVGSGNDFNLVLYGKYGADGTSSKTHYHTADSGEKTYNVANVS